MSGPYSLPRFCRPSKENAQALSKVLADSDPASPEWDIEKGLAGPLTQSPDPLLRLGRLPSISESGSRKGKRPGIPVALGCTTLTASNRSLLSATCALVSCQRISWLAASMMSLRVPAGKSSPFSMPSAPAPMYMRAMSFPSHLMIPESVFGSNALLQPAGSAQKPAAKLPPKGKGSPVEYPVDFPPVSSSESNSDNSSGLSPRASFPQRPSSKYACLPVLTTMMTLTRT